MNVEPTILHVFSHFQNLNLLVLLEDLRSGRIVQGAWTSGRLLCPLAHGMPGGGQVVELQFLSQAAPAERTSKVAGDLLGADPRLILRFVDRWDEAAITPEVLQAQLEEMWQERLDDADLMQEFLTDAEVAAGSASGQ